MFILFCVRNIRYCILFLISPLNTYDYLYILSNYNITPLALWIFIINKNIHNIQDTCLYYLFPY